MAMKTKIKKIKAKLLKTHKKAHKTSLRLFEFIIPEAGIESAFLMIFRQFLSWWIIPIFFILVLLVLISKKIISLTKKLNISKEKLYFLIFIFIFLALILIMALSQIITPTFSSKASTSIETKQPTAFNDTAGKTVNESKAYDNNPSTKSDTQTKFIQDPSILFYGWSATNQIYTALDLKLTYSAQDAADDTYSYYYSTSGLSDCSDYATRSWLTLLAPTSAGVSETTLTQALSTAQDLTQLCIKIATEKIGSLDNKNVYTHEIFTEGAYLSGSPPTGLFNSANLRTDGSGLVDIFIEANDLEGGDAKAKIMYKSGACSGNFNNKPALEETAGAIADYGGNPDIDNDGAYQVGSVAPIKTNSGSNTINFVWDSKVDLPAGNGNYCLQLTLNDGLADQAVLATQSLVIDNVLPADLSSLSFGQVNTSYATLQWPAVSETNFNHYEIWYGQNLIEVQNRVGLVSQSIISDQSAINATISSLNSGATYYFKIWAIDNYGNEETTNYIFTTIPFPSSPSAYTSPENIQSVQDSKKEIEKTEDVKEKAAARGEEKEKKEKNPSSSSEKIGKPLSADNDKSIRTIQPFFQSSGEARTDSYYVVQPGDSLAKIASKTQSSVKNIIELNEDRFPNIATNPSLIYSGWELKYETSSIVENLQNQEVNNISQNNSSIEEKESSDHYMVQKGDFLVKIAKKIYGDAGQWIKLVELNKERFPSLITNPSFIIAGWNFSF